MSKFRMTRIAEAMRGMGYTVGLAEIDEQQSAAERAAAARHAATRYVGLRGLREIDDAVAAAPLGEAMTKKSVSEIARRHRRVRVSIRAATDVLLTYAAAAVAVRWSRSEIRRAERHLTGAAYDASRRSGAHAGRRARSARDVQPRPGAVLQPRYIWPCRTTDQLADQLDRRRREEVTADIESAFAHGASHVSWVETADRCGVTVDAEDDWGGYSKRCKYSMRIWSVMVRAKLLLRSEMPGGRRVHHGLITLSAEQQPSPDGETRVYNAVWLRKSRGVSWYTERGTIAVSASGEVVHGRSERVALSTLRARQTTQQRNALRRRGVDRATALAEYGDRRLTWRIARRAGLCAEGIRAWALAHFPDRDPVRDSVTVREALETRSSESLILDAVSLLTA